MWSLSAQFLQALTGPHQLITTLTVTVPNGSPIAVPVQAGNISVDSQAQIRRTAQITAYGNQTVYAACATPGAQFSIQHGLVMGNVTQMIPVFAGELSGNAQQDLGDGTITLELGDFSSWLSRCQFLTPYVPGNIARVTAITNVVQAARPGTTVINLSSDQGLVPAASTWSTGALDVISDLSTDGGLDCSFGPDGNYYIRNQQNTASQPVWTVTAGPYGLIETASRAKPSDRWYNVVVVQPPAGTTQTWTQQSAQITDPANPRYPGNIGYVPYFWTSPSITDAADALAAAQRILSYIQGSDTTLALTLIANPALEANDVIRVATPQVGQQNPLIFQHFVDSFNFDLQTGDMTLNTRSQIVLT